eukprot:scaffold115027_cov32-Tisochrysis_lutea.AAC.2
MKGASVALHPERPSGTSPASGLSGSPAATSSASACSAAASSAPLRLTVSCVKPPSVARSGAGSVAVSMAIAGGISRSARVRGERRRTAPRACMRLGREAKDSIAPGGEGNAHAEGAEGCARGGRRRGAPTRANLVLFTL